MRPLKTFKKLPKLPIFMNRSSILKMVMIRVSGKKVSHFQVDKSNALSSPAPLFQKHQSSSSTIPLSAVDTETDMNIRSALKKRQEQSTTLIITHRVATAKDADKIVVLEEGKIVQVGHHDQLIKEDGLYKRIFDIQTRMA